MLGGEDWGDEYSFLPNRSEALLGGGNIKDIFKIKVILKQSWAKSERERERAENPAKALLKLSVLVPHQP